MTTILQWQRLYNEGDITALQPKSKGRLSMSQFNIKALLKKPISELTPEELRRRLEYAEAETAYLKKLEALAQSKAVKENKPKSSLS
jgi:transposase